MHSHVSIQKHHNVHGIWISLKYIRTYIEQPCTLSDSNIRSTLANPLPVTWLSSCTVSSSPSHQSTSQCRPEHLLVCWQTYSAAPTTSMHQRQTNDNQWINSGLHACSPAVRQHLECGLDSGLSAKNSSPTHRHNPCMLDTPSPELLQTQYHEQHTRNPNSSCSSSHRTCNYGKTKRSDENRQNQIKSSTALENRFH